MALSLATRRQEFRDVETFGGAAVFKCGGRVSGVELGSTAGGELFVIPSHCGSEACPSCGTPGSFFHMRRAARVARAIGGASAKAHLTLTLSSKMADLADPFKVGLELADQVARGVLRAAFRLVRSTFPESDGFFARIRLHWAGDLEGKSGKGSDRCRIHVHALIGHDEDRRMYINGKPRADGGSDFGDFRAQLLANWNRRLRAFFRETERTRREAGDLDTARMLEAARRDLVRDCHYRYMKTAEEWIGAITYETGPRLRNLWPWNPERWSAYVDGDPDAVASAAEHARNLYEVFAHGFPPSRWYGRSKRDAPELPRPETRSDADTAAIEAAILRELEAVQVRGPDGRPLRLPGKSYWTGLPITWEHVGALAADTFRLWSKKLAPIVPLSETEGMLYQGPDPDTLSELGLDPMIVFEPPGGLKHGRSGP